MTEQKSGFTLDDQKVYIFLMLACLLVYANSLSGDFIFDDTAQIVTNQSLNSWQNIINAFTTDVWAFQREAVVKTDNIPPPYYRPLFTVYLTIGYQLFGLWQQGWHLLNLAVHIGASVLVYRLFLLLGKGNIRLAFIGSLLFALTPVHVESISWISGIPDPLATLFYAPAMIFYIRWREGGHKKLLVFSVIFFFLALLCKETPIVLPVILFIWELTLNRKGILTDNFFTAVKSLVIFAVPILVYFVMRVSVLGKISWKHPFITQTPTELIYATIPFVFTYYLKNILFPFSLSLIYPTRFVNGFDDLNLWIPLVILLGLGGAMYFFRSKITPLMWLALGLFIVPLLPVLNLQVFHYEYIVQDRYLYLPSIGFVLFVACLLEKLLASDKKIFQQAALAVTVLLCVSYAAGTVLQNRMWHSAIDLWSHAISFKPNSWSNYYNLGLAYLQEKNYEEAARQTEKSLDYQAFDRREDLIRVNLGLAKKGLGKTEEAKADFLKALEVNPKSIEATTNLGALLFDQGNYREAETQFKKGLQLNPSDPPLNYNLARTYAKNGRHKEALEIYANLLQKEKQNPELLYDIAVSYAASGEAEKAKSFLNEAKKFPVDNELKQKILDAEQKLTAK